MLADIVASAIVKRIRDWTGPTGLLIPRGGRSAPRRAGQDGGHRQSGRWSFAAFTDRQVNGPSGMRG